MSKIKSKITGKRFKKARNRGRVKSDRKPKSSKVSFYIPDLDATTPHIIIEDDLKTVHTEIARLVTKRYKQKPGFNFTEQDSSKDVEDRVVGIIGEAMFKTILLQLKIPHLYAGQEHIFKAHRPSVWDFDIPNFGSIEVKTCRENARYLMIPKILWDTETSDAFPDYVVVIKLNGQEGHLVGYLHGKEVSKLEIRKKGEFPATYADAYVRELKQLRPSQELLQKLRERFGKGNSGSLDRFMSSS